MIKQNLKEKMRTVCAINMCAGCMACINICPKEAITIRDDLFAYNAVINENLCINCKACYQICQSNNSAKMQWPKEWYQGWAENTVIRERSSSGGFATAIAEAFINNGGIVCSCTFKSGKFVFEFAENEEELQKFIGSKYVKSDPKGVYLTIKGRLQKGEKLLFIGLPCQVSAIRNYVGQKFENNLYTCDLICHGTPSPKLLEIFLKQYGINLSSLKNIQFRKKANFMIYDDELIITNGVSDKYSIAFLNSLIYTENCYNCPYAGKKRVSDLTLGDSWGSELIESEQRKGISLALCQSEKGKKLLDMSRIHLEPVNINKAIANNHQLEYPSIRPKGRVAFFKGLNRRTFNWLVFRQFPKQCIRQNIKQVLIKTKLLRRYNQ